MIINISLSLIKEEDIAWIIHIDETSSPERFSILRNSANDRIMIYIFAQSFEKLEVMRAIALKELRKQILKGTAEYI